MTGEILPPGSVIVTPEDMWKAIGEIRDTGHRTETAITELRLLVNPALAEVRDDVAKLDAREQAHHDSHNDRLRLLEEQSWASRWAPAIVMSLLVSGVGGAIVFVVTQSLR